MGACGCAPTKLARLPAPGEGNWYVLELYAGCEYCGADWSVLVTEVNQDDPTWEFFEDTEEADFWTEEHVPFRTWAKKVIDAHTLTDHFHEFTGEPDMYADLSWLFKDFVDRNELGRVFGKTLRKEDS